MDEMLERIARHVPGVIGERKKLRCAVVIPLIETENGYEILFEVRSNAVPSQPGDVCLPGGVLEPGETAVQAAVREACEELLISPGQLTVIGEADTYEESHIVLRPFVVTLRDYEYAFNPAEVAEVFTAPLSYFIDNEPECYRIDFHPTFSEDFPFDRIVGGKDYAWRKMDHLALFYEVSGHTIWGITARILRAFSQMAAGRDGP